MANTFYYVAWRTFTLCTYHIHFPITLFLFLFFENNGRWYWVIYRMGLGGEGLSQDLLSILCLLLALCLPQKGEEGYLSDLFGLQLVLLP